MVLADHAVLAHVHLVHEAEEVSHTALLTPTQAHGASRVTSKPQSLKVDCLHSIPRSSKVDVGEGRVDPRHGETRQREGK